MIIKRERKGILNKLLKDPFVQSEDKIGSRIAEVFDSMAIRQEKEMAATLQKIEAKFDILEKELSHAKKNVDHVEARLKSSLLAVQNPAMPNLLGLNAIRTMHR